MTLTVRSARYANAEHTAIVAMTDEAAAVLLEAPRAETSDERKTAWRDALALKPDPYTPPPEPPQADPVEQLADFLRANPAVKALLGMGK